MIVNLTSKVFGPSMNNFYEAWDDLGLMNLESLGFLAEYEGYGKYIYRFG